METNSLCCPIIPEYNLGCDGKQIKKEPKEESWDLQEEEFKAADIPEVTKKLIAAEFLRLKRLRPTWKPSKAARKAGEKYNVKFVFE